MFASSNEELREAIDEIPLLYDYRNFELKERVCKKTLDNTNTVLLDTGSFQVLVSENYQPNMYQIGDSSFNVVFLGENGVLILVFNRNEVDLINDFIEKYKTNKFKIDEVRNEMHAPIFYEGKNILVLGSEKRSKDIVHIEAGSKLHGNITKLLIPVGNGTVDAVFRPGVDCSSIHIGESSLSNNEPIIPKGFLMKYMKEGIIDEPFLRRLVRNEEVSDNEQNTRNSGKK